MSTCSEKSLHSVYLDGELTGSYAKEYEEHLKTCPKCQRELNRLKEVHNRIVQDSNSISFSKESLDESFQRLEFKMAYHKNTTKTNNKSFALLKYAGVGVAAAAVMIFLFPFARNTNSRNINQPMGNEIANEKFVPITRDSLRSPANSDVIVNGTLNPTEVSRMFTATSDLNNVNDANTVQVDYSSAIPRVPIATPIEKNSVRSHRKPFAKYDMFIDTFDETKGIPSFERYTDSSFKYSFPVSYSPSGIGSTK